MGQTESKMSCLFLDGPAKDVALELRRAPFFLRVVESKIADRSTFDALDQLDDQPKPEETIHVYWLAGEPMRGMIDGAKYRGPFLAAWYRLVPAQPTDAEVRTTAAWRLWTEANRPKRVLTPPECANKPEPTNPPNAWLSRKRQGDSRPRA